MPRTMLSHFAARRTGASYVALLLMAAMAVSCSEKSVLPPCADFSLLGPELAMLLREKYAAASARSEDPESVRDYAMALYFNDRFREALPVWVHLARLSPEEPRAIHYQAHCIFEFGDLEAAADRYTSVIKRFPTFAPAYHERGRLFMKRAEIEGAEADFRKAAELDPGKFNGWLGLGDVAVQRGDFAEAKKLYEKALWLDPKEKLVHYALGLAQRGLGEKEAAERSLARGSGAVPMRMQDGGWSTRQFEFSRSISSMTTTAIGAIQSGNMQAGVKLLEKLYQQNPDNLEVLVNLAGAYQDSKQPQKAKALLEKALAKDPKRDATLVNLAALYLNLGDPKRALEYADISLKGTPEFAPAHFNRGNALARLNRPREAILAYRQAIRFDARNGKVRSALGAALMALGQHDEARREIEAGLVLEPDYLTAKIYLAESCLARGDRAAAEAAFDSARRQAPNDPDVLRLAKRF